MAVVLFANKASLIPQVKGKRLVEIEQGVRRNEGTRHAPHMDTASLPRHGAGWHGNRGVGADSILMENR